LNEAKIELAHQFKEFRLSEALKTIYSLVWDDFCSWYLEWVKPGFEQPIDKTIYEKTVVFFTELMQLLHPFMPFITEEIYHQLKERKDDITVKHLPAIKEPQVKLVEQGKLLKEVITAIRDARNRNQLKPKDPVRLSILTNSKNEYQQIETILLKQVNAQAISYDEPKSSNLTVVVQKDKFFIETTTPLDTTSQKEQLQKDLEYLKGFLIAVDKKLGNGRFVQNAKPEVVEIEKKKKADAEAKIKVIEESLSGL
jgi:valyl-tRNA synthetase